MYSISAFQPLHNVKYFHIHAIWMLAYQNKSMGFRFWHFVIFLLLTEYIKMTWMKMFISKDGTLMGFSDWDTTN